MRSGLVAIPGLPVGGTWPNACSPCFTLLDSSSARGLSYCLYSDILNFSRKLHFFGDSLLRVFVVLRRYRFTEATVVVRGRLRGWLGTVGWFRRTDVEVRRAALGNGASCLFFASSSLTRWFY